MANLCEKLIAQCIGADCDKPLFSGVDSEALIANYKEVSYTVETATNTSGNASIVESITMAGASGSDPACFYTVTQLGKNPFEGSQTELVEGTYGNKFTNTIQLAIPDNSPEVTNNIIDNIANGRFVVIVKNDYNDDTKKNKWQVFGLQKGLRCTAMTREFYGDNDSAYIVTLTEENVPKSGLFIYKTDESTTDAMIEGLKCSCN